MPRLRRLVLFTGSALRVEGLGPYSAGQLVSGLEECVLGYDSLEGSGATPLLVKVLERMGRRTIMGNLVNTEMTLPDADIMTYHVDTGLQPAVAELEEFSRSIVASSAHSIVRLLAWLQIRATYSVETADRKG